MDRVLMVFVLIWSSGLQAEETNTSKVINDIRLEGGSSRCSGLLQVKHQDTWSEVDDSDWDLKLADEICRQLDCGSVVQAYSKYTDSSAWRKKPFCFESESKPRKCLTKRSRVYPSSLEIICSDSVRLVNGTSLCSGRLQVKSNQSWSSVCEGDFDRQDAEVVCRELGCGTPSIFQGGLYGEGEAPVWDKNFHCKGNESALLDCGSSGSARETCSPGEAVGLTCSEPVNVRLVGGSSRCAGELEVKQQGEWTKVDAEQTAWTLKTADVVCRQMDCGSVILAQEKQDNLYKTMSRIDTACLQSESVIRECVVIKMTTSVYTLEIVCSDSVRLVNGSSLCSGTLQVKYQQSWSSVCEADFDQLDAEVVCRELGCGTPTVLRGGLYGEEQAPLWRREFQCKGNESALLDCGGSDSAPDTCSPGEAVGITCSERDNMRLSGGTSRCDGTLEMKVRGEWRPVVNYEIEWDQKVAAVCRQLDCGSAVSTKTRYTRKPVWLLRHPCGQSDSLLRECLVIQDFIRSATLVVMCSDILAQPNISFSVSNDGDSEAQQRELQVLMGSSFTISCSILPQYAGGSFQLSLTTSAMSHNYTLAAVNHSAHFLFSAADQTHQGVYRCVYHVYVFSYNFSSESQPLHLTVSASLTILTISVILVKIVIFSLGLFFYCKVIRGWMKLRKVVYSDGRVQLLGVEAQRTDQDLAEVMMDSYKTLESGQCSQ
uniref:SRCR domain-containing protein n=1 Tax=Anabas testudineus TaxID=64144 RepID=A0A7N6F855_ANATE